jgi:hypothetical protein
MTLREQLEAIEDALKDFARDNAATVVVANDVEHLFQIIGEGAGTCRVGILFVSEKPRSGEHSDLLNRVDRVFHVGIARRRGYNLVPGDSLTEDTASGAPMCDLLESARDAIKSIVMADFDEPLPHYGGTELMTMNGQVVDAYRLEFSMAADLPDPETEDTAEDA